MNKFVLLSIFLLVPLFLSLFIKQYEGFSLSSAMGDVPKSQTQVLVQDTYPRIKNNKLSNDSGETIWEHYPVFPLGSYEQTTNNIRYPDNPDNGTCMPASMCGALYHDKHLGSNIITPLPPVNDEMGTRVGYFTTTNSIPQIE